MIRIYAIRDLVSKAILGGLHFFRHPAPAIRFFGDIASDPQTQIARHPQDYDLIAVATFDEDTLKLDGFDEPEIVITGAQWAAAQASKAETSET